MFSRKSNIRYRIWYIMVLFFFSCEGPVGPAGPLQRGDLFGRLEMVDQFGNFYTDHSNVEVTLEGSDPVLKTMTNADGEYYFENVPTGTYNLSFYKKGFQEWKIFSSVNN